MFFNGLVSIFFFNKLGIFFLPHLATEEKDARELQTRDRSRNFGVVIFFNESSIKVSNELQYNGSRKNENYDYLLFSVFLILIVKGQSEKDAKEIYPTASKKGIKTN